MAFVKETFQRYWIELSNVCTLAIVLQVWCIYEGCNIQSIYRISHCFSTLGCIAMACTLYMPLKLDPSIFGKMVMADTLLCGVVLFVSWIIAVRVAPSDYVNLVYFCIVSWLAIPGLLVSKIVFCSLESRMDSARAMLTFAASTAMSAQPIIGIMVLYTKIGTPWVKSYDLNSVTGTLAHIGLLFLLNPVASQLVLGVVGQFWTHCGRLSLFRPYDNSGLSRYDEMLLFPVLVQFECFLYIVTRCGISGVNSSSIAFVLAFNAGYDLCHFVLKFSPEYQVVTIRRATHPDHRIAGSNSLDGWLARVAEALAYGLTSPRKLIITYCYRLPSLALMHPPGPGSTCDFCFCNYRYILSGVPLIPGYHVEGIAPNRQIICIGHVSDEQMDRIARLTCLVQSHMVRRYRLKSSVRMVASILWWFWEYRRGLPNTKAIAAVIVIELSIRVAISTYHSKSVHSDHINEYLKDSLQEGGVSFFLGIVSYQVVFFCLAAYIAQAGPFSGIL